MCRRCWASRPDRDRAAGRLPATMVSARPTYSVLYADATLLVVDKAPGVLVVPPPGSHARCLLDDLRRDGHAVAPVHRLDRDTSGRAAALPRPRATHRARRRVPAARGGEGIPRAGARRAARAARDDRRADPRPRPHGARRPPRPPRRDPLRSPAHAARASRRRHGQPAALPAGERPAQPESACTLAWIGHPLLGDATYGRRPRGTPPPTGAHRAACCTPSASRCATRQPARASTSARRSRPISSRP